MSHATCYQSGLVKMTEGYVVDLLTEGFGFKEDNFLEPIPDTDLIVRFRTDRGKVVALGVETDLGI